MNNYSLWVMDSVKQVQIFLKIMKSFSGLVRRHFQLWYSKWYFVSNCSLFKNIIQWRNNGASQFIALLGNNFGDKFWACRVTIVHSLPEKEKLVYLTSTDLLKLHDRFSDEIKCIKC